MEKTRGLFSNSEGWLLSLGLFWVPTLNKKGLWFFFQLGGVVSDMWTLFESERGRRQTTLFPLPSCSLELMQWFADGVVGREAAADTGCSTVWFLALSIPKAAAAWEQCREGRQQDWPFQHQTDSPELLFWEGEMKKCSLNKKVCDL